MRFETDSWPIVAAHVEGTLDDPEVDNLISELDGWLEKGHHVAIYDLTTNEKVQFEHLTQMGRWISEQGPRLLTQKGTIFVVQSPFMRAAVNFILDMLPQSGHVRMVASMDEARGYAEKLVA